MWAGEAQSHVRTAGRALPTVRSFKGDMREAANVRACRLAGAMARMMATFQQGVIVLERKRSGGVQRVQVQHVTVADGGQAVIAGKRVTAGGISVPGIGPIIASAMVAATYPPRSARG